MRSPSTNKQPAEDRLIESMANKLKVVVSPEALEIHQSGMLWDGHNDLPWAMREQAASSFDNLDIARPTNLQTDIPRLQQGGLKVQFWSVFVPATTMQTETALLTTMEQIDMVHEMCRRYPDSFTLALTAEDVERSVREGKIASLIGMEGGHSIENSLQNLHRLYDRGARYMTLTHSKNLDWADSATDIPVHNGLTDFGKEVVAEMNRLGMLVDISHVSEKVMHDVLDVTQAPVMFSHSSAKALCDHPRNVSDDILKRLPQNGGVIMINFNSGFVVPTETLKTDPQAQGNYLMVVDHIEHVIKVAGIDHVGLGSDFDGVPSTPRGLEDVSTYPNLTQELLNRGYSKADIHKILGGNMLRVLQATEVVAQRLTQK